MKPHYNIYYLFLEEMQKQVLSEISNTRIRKRIEAFYESLKPPWSQTQPQEAKSE